MDNAKTVLVVDDDPSIVELMSDFLENDGFRVESATSVEDALRWSQLIKHKKIQLM